MIPPTLKHEHRQQQTLTPRLQHAVRLLQMSALDYEQELRDMMQRNPFLEVEEPSAPSRPEPSGDAASRVALDADAITSEAPGDASSDAPGGPADAAWDAAGDAWALPSQGAHDGSRESSMSATDMMVAPTGLREQLRSQANLLPLSERDHALVCGVIESLDDDGYLRMDLTELGPLMALDPPADESELSTALRLVQSFEPAGVGARHVGECLLLQVDKVDPAWRELSRRIVTSHLELLARRDSVALAARLGCSVTAAESACQAVRRLDPRPGWTCGHADLPYVTPDVVVRKVRGQWLAQLNPAVRPRVRLNRGCAELFARHREARHAELGAHLQEARWTLRNIEQRFSTIQAVAQAILRRQHMFFDYGPLAMKPLALRDIAREVGVHESTVCRVTNNKYMATPSGLFELKHFFSRAMPMSNGAASTGSAIRSVVQELIEGENPEQPLSDVAITQRLAREGLNVARRTVTKYRQALKIAPAERRRVALATPG